MVKMLTEVEKADLTSLFISPERNPVPAEQLSIVSFYIVTIIYLVANPGIPSVRDLRII